MIKPHRLPRVGAEALADSVRARIAARVEQDGALAVAELTDTSIQTVYKALARLPLYPCSRRRLMSVFGEASTV
jgi:hypothetical protein